MKVQVIKCLDKLWYKKYIGHVFNVIEKEDFLKSNKYYVTEENGKPLKINGSHAAIYKADTIK